MIVEMAKVQVVVRAADRERLLETLGDLGGLHLEPVDPGRAVAEEQIAASLDRLKRARQVLSLIEPAGEKPEITAAKAVDEVLAIERDQAERHSRLASLHRQLEHQAVWGQIRLADLVTLSEAGVEPEFYTVSAAQISEIKAELVATLGQVSRGRFLVAVVQRDGEAEIPERAEMIVPLYTDNPTIQGEAAQLDAELRVEHDRLAQLANLQDEIEEYERELLEQMNFSVARRGGLDDEHLFAVQGWAPADKAPTLEQDLAQAGVPAALRTMEPAEDEGPPTLISYPRWALPIKGLFAMLGTVAGYREFDVGAPFMVALPLFAAMLIGDGGYGAVLLLGPLLAYKKVAPALGEEFTRLLMVVGAVALIWGFLCGSFFGVTIYNPPIPVNMTDESRTLLMRISFALGAVHLSMAQLWQAVRLWPSLRALNRVGWAAFIWGMLGVVKMFVLKDDVNWGTPWPYLLAVGATLAILFAQPDRNVLKMLALGLADFPLSMLSAFSDVISYVRLMAVGLASGVLAVSFNELALGSGSWFIAVPTLIFGHGLNLGLALIALFAHGVRLNMLEFSNNLGMQWTGHAYNPFMKRITQEK